MKIFIQCIDYKSWMMINNGLCLPTKKVGKKRVLKPEEEYTDDELKTVEQNAKALHLLYCTINVEVFQTFSGYVSAKKLWDDLQEKYEALEEAMEESQTCFMANEEKEWDVFTKVAILIPSLFNSLLISTAIFFAPNLKSIDCHIYLSAILSFQSPARSIEFIISI
ncbi:unnamed protein product [Cuscuta campestris]|uniref:UBN2 domain-containing protein n=1 Tax=Cuscuta campestris TaxID=132261 RepID=A0A484LTZ3_9ASTE|nr:unnamed protein product [Cuscuta campestris]